MNKVSTCKDLGATTEPRLTFIQHINNLVLRANARASLIHECFLCRDHATLVRAFITYVPPLLEYASSMWSPYRITAVRKLESIQRRFTKRLPGLTSNQLPK